MRASGTSEAPTYEISLYYRRILVPVDGSEHSFKALDLAADFAKRFGSRLVVVYARPRGHRDQGPIDEARKRLEARGVVAELKAVEYDPAHGSPATAVLREAIDGGYDVVIVGAKGRGGIFESNVGSVALALAANSPTSVFVVR